MLSRKPTIKALLRQHRCPGWSRPLLFACNKVRFSHVEAHIMGLLANSADPECDILSGSLLSAQRMFY